jgi:hypothetical protein
MNVKGETIMIAERFIGNLFGSKIGNELDALVQAYAVQGKFAGVVLVARKGEILLKKGYGLANREHDVPNTPQTIFRIGSMTKPFTARQSPSCSLSKLGSFRWMIP